MSNIFGSAYSFGGGVSDVHTTPFPHALGTRARDAAGNEYVYCDYTSSAAPEAMVVITESFTASVISSTNFRGMIGIVPDFAKIGQSASNPTMPASYQWSSNNAGWVQIYGRAYLGFGAAVATLQTASDAANGPTSVDTSGIMWFTIPTSATTPLGCVKLSTGYAGSTSGSQYIRGIYVATDTSLGTIVSNFVGTTAGSTDPTNYASFHANARMAVWLNYPYVATITNPSNA